MYRNLVNWIKPPISLTGVSSWVQLFWRFINSIICTNESVPYMLRHFPTTKYFKTSIVFPWMTLIYFNRHVLYIITFFNRQMLIFAPTKFEKRIKSYWSHILIQDCKLTILIKAKIHSFCAMEHQKTTFWQGNNIWYFFDIICLGRFQSLPMVLFNLWAQS